MSQIIQGQILFVLATMCCGMLLMALYDVLRFLRWLLPHSGGWVWIEDLLYWTLMAVPVYYLFFVYNEGIIRWYGLVGLLTGAVLYETGISLPIRSFLGKWADRIRWKCGAPIRRIRKIYQEHKKRVLMQSVQKEKRILTTFHKFNRKHCEKPKKGV